MTANSGDKTSGNAAGCTYGDEYIADHPCFAIVGSEDIPDEAEAGDLDHCQEQV